ncbi:MAG: hypothetical protein JNM43_11640 [Planctomycetaceae bacterium]|nr:hypothetical protein [Planctomycetaceae bacterium]
MNVAQLIEKIAGRQKERQQQKVQSYRDLVKHIAGGKEPDPASVEATLEAAGKSLDDLQKAVRLYEQRMTWKAQVAMQPSLEKERDRLHREIAAADKALDDAETHHSEVTGPLHGELAQIKDGLSDASTARSRLFDTCDDESLWQQLRELNREGQRLVLENQGLQSRLAYLQSRSEQQAAKVDEESNEVTKASRQQVVKDLLKEADEVCRTMKSNSVQCQELAKRSERIEQQMREW